MSPAAVIPLLVSVLTAFAILAFVCMSGWRRGTGAPARPRTVLAIGLIVVAGTLIAVLYIAMAASRH